MEIGEASVCRQNQEVENLDCWLGRPWDWTALYIPYPSSLRAHFLIRRHKNFVWIYKSEIVSPADGV